MTQARWWRYKNINKVEGSATVVQESSGKDNHKSIVNLKASVCVCRLSRVLKEKKHSFCPKKRLNDPGKSYNA